MNRIARPQTTFEIASFLVVDDDAINIMSMRRTMKKLGLANPVHVASNGLEALDILRGTDGAAALRPPYIIILDLNMPKMSGHEFLVELRNDAGLQTAVVFIMSTSDAPRDVEEAYRANAAGYILKDGSPESFREALDMIGSFSEVVTLPG